MCYSNYGYIITKLLSNLNNLNTKKDIKKVEIVLYHLILFMVMGEGIDNLNS